MMGSRCFGAVLAAIIAVVLVQAVVLPAPPLGLAHAHDGEGTVARELQRQKERLQQQLQERRRAVASDHDDEGTAALTDTLDTLLGEVEALQRQFAATIGDDFDTLGSTARASNRYADRGSSSGGPDQQGAHASSALQLFLDWFRGGMLLLVIGLNVYLWRVRRVEEANAPKDSTESDASTEKEQLAKRRKQNVLLVIAHPDDESMFFGPTVRSLVESGFRVHLLALSSGDAYGQGKVRSKELTAAAALLGIPQENCDVVNDERLLDGMDTDWPSESIASHVHAAVQRWSISNIITFDSHGVSGHRNHISTHHGVKKYLSANGSKHALRGFFLTSVPLLRKYLGPLDFVFVSPGLKHVSLAGFSDWAAIRRAMLAHKSQMVWYRYLWIHASRYMYINTLQRWHPASDES